MNDHIKKRIEAICKKLYRKQVDVKPIPLKWAEGYYLTERGDLLIFRGKKPMGRISRGKNDTIQFYQNGERVFWMVRRKLMILTFRNFTLGMLEDANVFPINGKPNDVKIDNLKVYESYAEGRRKTYDDDYQHKKTGLSTKQVLEIRKSRGKFDRGYLAEKYGVSKRTITRVWNNRSYVLDKIL